MDLLDRAAVVTGGASGIGAATMAALRSAGARPVAWDLEPGGRDDVVVCDVTDPDQVESAMRDTIDRIGVPSLLVAAAGIGGFDEVATADLTAFRRIVDVNLVGPLLSVQAVVSAVRQAGLDGSIVCISSVNASIADRGMAAYCCSKAALDMLVRVAAAELGPDRIRVNAVAPGVTDTPLFSDRAGRIPGFVHGIASRTPLGGIGTAEDVAAAALAVPATDWVTGQSLVVDGGLSLQSPIDPYGAIRRPPPQPDS